LHLCLLPPCNDHELCLPKLRCQIPFLARCSIKSGYGMRVFICHMSCHASSSQCCLYTRTSTGLLIHTDSIAAIFTQEHQPACASTRTPSLFVHRNINHEKLDAFMCNECGHSRFGKFELSMSMSPCVSYPPLQTQDDMLRALACLEHNVSTAHARHTSLATSVK
jgi:hypothetical protein